MAKTCKRRFGLLCGQTHRTLLPQLWQTPGESTQTVFFGYKFVRLVIGYYQRARQGNALARGALFETWAVTEALKWRAVRGDKQPIYYWRDNIGNEIDLLLEQGSGITLVEVKSGQTYQDEWQRSLQVVERHLGFTTRKAVLYGGDFAQTRNDVQIVPWLDLQLAD